MGVGGRNSPQATDVNIDKFMSTSGILEVFALAAEESGDDDLAAFYAEAGVRRYVCKLPMAASFSWIQEPCKGDLLESSYRGPCRGSRVVPVRPYHPCRRYGWSPVPPAPR